MEKLGLNIASQKALNDLSQNYPLAAIIIPPAGLGKLTEKLYYAERIAVRYFVELLNKFGRNQEFQHNTPEQQELFDRYFYYIFKLKGNKPKVFIARTILTSKEEYLNSSVKDIYSTHTYGGFELTEAVDYVLSDYFWLTEISVPELYWVNEAKIGEIIIDSVKDSSEEAKPGAGIQLLRLPYFLAMYPENGSEYYKVHLNNQASAHHPLLKKKEGIIRQYKPTV